MLPEKAAAAGHEQRLWIQKCILFNKDIRSEFPRAYQPPLKHVCDFCTGMGPLLAHETERRRARRDAKEANKTKRPHGNRAARATQNQTSEAEKGDQRAKKGTQASQARRKQRETCPRVRTTPLSPQRLCMRPLSLTGRDETTVTSRTGGTFLRAFIPVYLRVGTRPLSPHGWDPAPPAAAAASAAAPCRPHNPTPGQTFNPSMQDR